MSTYVLIHGASHGAWCWESVAAPLRTLGHEVDAPVIVGGGARSLPDDARVELELVDKRRFASGFAYLHYQLTARATSPAAA